MKDIIFKLNLITNTVCDNDYKFKKIAVFDDYIYIINPQKLDMVLSLIGLLGKFTEYYNFSGTTNITAWLVKNGLTTPELLDEISFYKTANIFHEQIDEIYSFSNDFHSKNINTFLQNMMRENFKNAILFDYLSETKEHFNDYVFNVLTFYKNKNLSPDMTFDEFVKSLLALDKFKLNAEFLYIDKLDISCTINNSFPYYLELNKVQNGTNKYYALSFKDNFEVVFKISNFDDDLPQNFNYFCSLFSYSNDFRIKAEEKLLQFVFARKQKTNLMEMTNANLMDKIKGSNCSFLNEIQILNLCLDEANKIRMNEMFGDYFDEKNLSKEYYFINNQDRIDLTNYAKITKLELR